MESQPSSRTGENPPYGMIGGIEETSASFEARSAPRSYPTPILGSRPPVRGGKKVSMPLPSEPARGHDEAVVGVVAGYLSKFSLGRARRGVVGHKLRSPFARLMHASRSGSRKTSPVCPCPSRQCCRAAPARKDRPGGGLYPGTHGFDWAENRSQDGWRHLQYRPTHRR